MSTNNEEIVYSEEQKAAIDMFRDNRFSILTGGPGVGKTTVVNEILNQHGSSSTILVAPTGKAAKRMSEVTERTATTIHRALEATMDNDGKFKFIRGESKPLTCSAIIVDEVSMVTNSLMADLMQAIGEHTKVLLVGDTDQLPSVGPGAVLRDMLNSGIVPHTNLTKIFRNSGDIVKACHKIANGRTFKPSPRLDPESGLNFRHIERVSLLEIKAVIEEVVTQSMPGRGKDPVWDVQVLSPMNDKGLLSCDSLNEMLQARLNPNKKIRPDDKFKINDKVINTKNMPINTKNMPINTTSKQETYIVNGDIGQVVDITEDKELIIRFFDPERVVLLKKSHHKNIKLAYCVTCHKMQGSEAKVIVIPVHRTFHFFNNRPWIYTAISRAKEICVTVGEFSAIEKSIGNGEKTSRKTFLTEKIKEAAVERSEI